MPPQKSRGRPLWLGEYPLARKTVLLHAEQGLGDTIQFARYVPLLAATGAKVVLEVQRELTALMARLDGAAAVIARGEAPPPFDVHCPLGSLPLALQDRARRRCRRKFLISPPTRRHLAKWSARLGALARPRIAIAWSGNPSHYQRPQPLDSRSRSLAPLLSAPAQLCQHPARRARRGCRSSSPARAA